MHFKINKVRTFVPPRQFHSLVGARGSTKIHFRSASNREKIDAKPSGVSRLALLFGTRHDERVFQAHCTSMALKWPRHRGGRGRGRGRVLVCARRD
jgi:hypothetical protein